MSLLSNILFDRFQSNKLANFYILKASQSDPNGAESLETCINQFLSKVLIQQAIAPNENRAHEMLKMGHPDILKVTPSDEARNYLKEDFTDFFRFQNFKAMELSHRFIAVYDSHKISTLISNKLLKTLEEPQEQTSIFFILPHGHLHLPTIQSRAITLTLRQADSKIPDKICKISFEQWIDRQQFESQLLQPVKSYFLANGSILELINVLKSDHKLQDELCLALVDWQLHCDSNYLSKQCFLDAIKRYKKAKIFHAPVTERLYCLLEATKRSLQNCQK